MCGYCGILRFRTGARTGGEAFAFVRLHKRSEVICCVGRVGRLVGLPSPPFHREQGIIICRFWLVGRLFLPSSALWLLQVHKGKRNMNGCVL